MLLHVFKCGELAGIDQSVPLVFTSETYIETVVEL
jgi:hypothetical protein